MKGLTKKQRLMLDFIERFINTEGMAPTVYEIGDYFKIKTSTVFAHLQALQKKGFISRSSKARSISLNMRTFPQTNHEAMLEIPLLGRISAGLPLESSENREGEVYFSPTMLRKGTEVNRLFALTVNGESMREMGIMDGDVIIVQQTNELRRGDVVVALVDNETTVKSYFPNANGTIELRPANPDFKPMFYPAEDVLVQGRVVGLQRSY